MRDDFEKIIDPDLALRRLNHARRLLAELTARTVARQQANDAAIVAAREARIEVGRTHRLIRDIVAGGK